MPIFFDEKMWEAFAVQKLVSFFQQENISVFGNKVLKHLTSWPLNELVKLTMLWTTGPRPVAPRAPMIVYGLMVVMIMMFGGTV